MTHDTQARPIQPSEKLDFQLGGGIPRFWNGGDPFKTRFFDAMSLTFPIGERYFISAVRAYRDQIADPQLLQEVKDFTRQEAQHGMVHTEFNAMLEGQGLNVGWTQRFLDRLLKDDGFGFLQRAKMLLKGAWWLYKPGGVFLPALGYYLSYYKPGFHPWQHTEMGHYDTWLKAYERTGDPVMASEAYSAQVMARA